MCYALQKVLLREREEREREKERFLAEQQRDQRLRDREERLQTLESQIKDAVDAKARTHKQQEEEFVAALRELEDRLRIARAQAVVWCVQRVRKEEAAAGRARAWCVWLVTTRRARDREAEILKKVPPSVGCLLLAYRAWCVAAKGKACEALGDRNS